MLKKITFTALAFYVFSALSLSAQNKTFFEETFEGTSNLLSVSAIPSALSSLVSDSSDLFAAPFSGKALVVSPPPISISGGSKLVYLELPALPQDTFATYNNLELHFDIINRLFNGSELEVEYSTDNKSTWTSISSTLYKGNSTAAGVSNYLSNETNYPEWFVFFNNITIKPSTQDFWKHEVFEVKTLVNTSLSSTIHFRLKINFSNLKATTNVNELVFLDNIKIVGGNCNPVLPRVIPNVPVITCSGFRDFTTNGYTNPSFQYSLILTGQLFDSIYLELIRNDSITLRYNYSGSGFLSFGIDINSTTTKTRVVAVNSCGARTTFPRKGFFTIIPKVVPIGCGGTDCEKGINVIREFPYEENFEGNEWVAFNNPLVNSSNIRGLFPTSGGENWVILPQNGQVNSAWCVTSWNNNSQPLYAPTRASLPSGGDKYLLMRTDFQGSNNQSSLYTPCIDLTTDSNVYVSFDYKLLMPSGTRLVIEAMEKAGNNYYPTIGGIEIFRSTSATAEQGEAFKHIALPLKAFGGKIIKLRISGVIGRAQPGGYIAFDNLRISKTNPNEVSLAGVVSSSSNDCAVSAADSIIVNLFCLDTNLSTIPVAYKINNGNTILDNVPVPAGHSVLDTLQYIVPTTGQINNGRNTVKFWHQLTQDPFATDDTLFTAFNYVNTIENFPYHENFENIANAKNLANWTISPLIINADTLTMRVFDDIYPSALTGPLRGTQKGTKYLALSSLTPLTLTNYEVTMQSACIDVSSLTKPVFGFDYHKPSAVRVKAEVSISTDGETFTTAIADLASASSTPSKSDINWRHYAVNLPTGTNTCIIRIKLTSNTLSSQTDELGFALDNFSIVDMHNKLDLGLLNVIENYRGGSLNRIFAGVYNANTTARSNVNTQLLLKWIPKCDTTASVITQTVNSSQSHVLSPFETVYVQFNGLNLVNVPSDIYALQATLISTNDAFEFNDTISKEFNVYTEETIPYFTDFESCTPGFFPVGEIQPWHIGTFTGRNFNAVSGTRALSTDSLKGTLVSSDERFLTPLFTGWDTIANPRISFDYLLGTTAGLSIEFNTGGGWTPITRSNGVNPINWPQFGTQFPASNTPVFASIEIPAASYAQNGIRFRFIADNISQAENVLIDNLRLDYPAQLDIEPVAIDANQVYFNPGGTNTTNINLTVRNNGLLDITNFFATINVNGSAWFADTLFLTSPVRGSKSGTVNIPTALPLNLAVNGILNLEIITKLPNKRADNIGVNDTFFYTVNVIDNEVNLPYCNDFSGASAPIVGSTLNKGASNPLWTVGVPNKNTIKSAAGGGNAIFTQGANYGSLEDAVFYLNPAMVYIDSCYTLSFKHHFITERNFDGGTVEYSLDTGNTWLYLGKEDGDSNWFNTKYIQALESVSPGFSGNSGGYINAAKVFNVPFTGILYIRFRFKSNATMHNEGWAIDDICLETAPQGCQTITLSESTFIENAVALFPNPAKTNFNLAVKNPKVSLQRVNVYSTSGAQLISKTFAAKSASAVINTEPWAKGLYIVVVQLSDNQMQQFKLIKE